MLDLIGEGPTARTLEHDVPVNSSIEFKPGYSLGYSILYYFKKDQIDLCITVYGMNDVKPDALFPNDSNPANNTACLEFNKQGIKLNRGIRFRIFSIILYSFLPNVLLAQQLKLKLIVVKG